MNAGENPEGFRPCPVHTFDGQGFSKTTADIVCEMPLQVFLNNHHIITTACTGLHVDELALGFLKSEGWISSSADIKTVRISPERTAVYIDTTAPIDSSQQEGSDRKTITSSGARSGRKGAPALSPEPVRTETFFLAPVQVLDLVERFLDVTLLHRRTRGTHCAALTDGRDILVSREDIGRHNAIDMLAGHALLKNMDCRDHAMLRTGRVSSEIVQKVWHLGIPVVVSLAVPTTLAIQLATEAGITLIGAIRGRSMQVYTHERRVGL